MNHTTAQPIELIWQDGLEVAKDLFVNLIFENHIMYDPHLVMTGGEHEYSEFLTSERAFFIQNQLQEGVTIVPIILASDKTPVTQQSGCLEMHPIFLTISNIQSKTLLHACLFHKCMDIIFAKCKVVMKTGKYMPDPMGYVQHCFTPLAHLIACVAKNTSPLMMATQKEFGDSHLHPLRIGTHTLRLIYDLCECVDPCIVPLFQHEAKFFGDHPLKWCKEVVGEEELDACYKVQHKCVGTHHFVATIDGATNTTPKFIHAIHVLTEFIYQAQSPVHTNSSIHAMVESFSEFHRLKQAILDVGTWRGKSGTIDNFLILKLELFHFFASSIKDSGGLIQYSSDVSEQLLITHCKFPFDRTMWAFVTSSFCFIGVGMQSDEP
ncbi:hypothetical protein DFH29DRAFT_983932 [Suillus ampliporus]|nr:hypothetical protein DFH29DRAFT_983932 [Suillus ampliporus]